jgi:hypothetical protein
MRENSSEVDLEPTMHAFNDGNETNKLKFFVKAWKPKLNIQSGS